MKKKILVVDDEPFFVEIFTMKFDEAGYEVVSARNGAEAVAKAQAEKPHLIVMDVMMPVMSGFDATQKIRQDPGMASVPIIVFTSRMSMGDFFHGMRAVEVMPKTAGADLVVARVKELIGEPPPSVGDLKRAVLLGVEDGLMEKVATLLKKFKYEVFKALHEEEAVKMVERLKPAAIFCQLWEDDSVLSAPKIAKELALKPVVAATPFYVYCKESLSVEAMKHFALANILAYRETSDLLKKLEALLSKN